MDTVSTGVNRFPISFLNPRLQAALPAAARRYLTLISPVLGEIRQAGEAWISQAKLAELAGVTERTIRNWERRLEQLGVFLVDRVQGTNRRLTLGNVLSPLIELTGKVCNAIRRTFPVRAVRSINKDRARASGEEEIKKGAPPQALRPTEQTKMNAEERGAWRENERVARERRERELRDRHEATLRAREECLRVHGVSSMSELAAKMAKERAAC